MRGLLGWSVLVCLSAVTIAKAQDNPANGNTVRSEITDSYGTPGERNVYVINNSSQHIIVTSIRLLECENIQGSCSTRRMKSRVPAGSRTMIHTVRPRSPGLGSGFSLSFTYEVEGVAAPDAKDVAKDKTAMEVDTVIVAPKILDLKVGETIDLSQALRVTALNAAGKRFSSIYFMPRVVLGDEYISIDGVKITAKAAGTGAISIAASAVATPNPNPKGATQIIVTVVP